MEGNATVFPLFESSKLCAVFDHSTLLCDSSAVDFRYVYTVE